ncbi:hypothetical protein ABNK63_03235 [Rhodanobacter sp. IGA1.0]|uniref:Oligosaccharide repeat unit polymerase n=1 Tax=Rhodanobacter sp. IGA1.0 TaxID=3158582 RepID=A0AAU7QMC0_9GAMM
MNDIVFAFLLIVGVFNIFWIGAEFVARKKLVGLHIFALFYSISYFITPSVEHFLPAAMGDEAIWAAKYNGGNQFFTVVFVLLGYLVSVMAYRVTMRMRRIRERQPRDEKKPMLIFVWLCLILSTICIVVYSSQYGGLLAALKDAAMIRAGGGDDLLQTDGNFLFLKYLIPVSAFSLLGLVALKVEYGYSNAVLVIICTIVVILGFLMMAGRNRFLGLGLALFILYFATLGPRAKFTPKRMLIIIGAICVGYFVLLYGKQFFASMSADSVSQAFEQRVANVGDGDNFKILQNFEHHYASIGAADAYVYDLSGMRYFIDVVNAPLSILPTRLVGMEKPVPISVYNTYMITGVYDSRIPPGLVAFGVYSLGYLGVLLVMAVYGYLLALLDRALLQPGFRRIIVPWIIVTLVVSGGSGDPRVLMYALLPAFFASALVLPLRKRFVFR